MCAAIKIIEKSRCISRDDSINSSLGTSGQRLSGCSERSSDEGLPVGVKIVQGTYAALAIIGLIRTGKLLSEKKRQQLLFPVVPYPSLRKSWRQAKQVDATAVLIPCIAIME